MADPNRLQTLVDHLVTALEGMGKEYGHRRNYRRVVRHLYDFGLEADLENPSIQVGLGTAEQPSEGGFDYSNTQIRRQDEVIVRVHMAPDKAADESLDMLTPALDFEADVEAAVMAARHRGDQNATTFYKGTLRGFYGDAEGIGATVEVVFVIDWYHTTGDASSV